MVIKRSSPVPLTLILLTCRKSPISAALLKVLRLLV
nr:MAG TPA: hypothetical protein [Caudoviricetes sp.]